MPVMVQGVVNGQLQFWSDEPVDIVDIYGPSAPEHVYLPRVVSIDEVRFGSDSPHGGYVRLTYGTLTLTHEPFLGRVGDWPPPRRIPIAVWYTTAPQHTRLFEGAAQLDRITAEGVVYSLRPYDEFTIETEDREYKDTLVNIFTAACTDLDLTLDATDARESVAISYVAKGKQLLINNLDHMARWSCHRFWVDDGVLYLSDLFKARGATISLTSRDVHASEYTWNQPYRKYSADYTQPFVRNLLLVIQSAEAGTSQAIIAEMKYSRAQGSPLITGPAVVASSEQSGSPASNLRDGSTSTVWANDITTNPIGGSTPVSIQIGVATGTIGEYALTARNNATPIMPSRWDLYGNNVDVGRYMPLGTVESTGWGALEERRFPVPTDANWPVEVPGGLKIGDEFRASPSCHRTYSVIWNSLRVIKGVVERPVITLDLPMPTAATTGPLTTPPLLGQRIALRDTSLVDDETGLPVTNSWLHVDGIGYDFVGHRCLVYGAGAIAAGANVMSAAAVSCWRFEQLAGGEFLDHLDLSATNNLVVSGAVTCSTSVSIEGDGSAYFSQSDVQTMACAEVAMPATWPFKSGTTNRTLTISMRVRFAKGHAADVVTLAQKWSSGGFRLLKNADGSLTVSVWDTAERTATGGLPAKPSGFLAVAWRPETWYHVVLQLSLTPTAMMGGSGRQWAMSVYDEDRDWWLIYPGGGSFGVASMAVTTAPFQIGGTSARLYGWVDEVAVYNTILSLDDLILLRERTYVELYA